MSNLLTSFFFELAKQKKLIKQAEDGPADLERNKKSAELAKKLIVNLVREMDVKTQGAFAKNVGQDVTVFQAQSGVSTDKDSVDLAGLTMQRIKSFGAFLQYLSINNVKANGEYVVITPEELNQQGWNDKQKTDFINNPNILSIHELVPDFADQGYSAKTTDGTPTINPNRKLGDFDKLDPIMQKFGELHLLRIGGNLYYAVNNEAQNACFCWKRDDKKYAGEIAYQTQMDDYPEWKLEQEKAPDQPAGGTK